MAEEIILRRCLEDDTESVLELWSVADATASVTDTSHDLRLTINCGVTPVMIVDHNSWFAGGSHRS